LTSEPPVDDTTVHRTDPAQRVDDLQRGPSWSRLESQIKWYEHKSASNKRNYAVLKVTQLVAAALVPVVASVHAAVWITGGLGALVVVLEGVQQLFQFEANWIGYRSTAEALNHERYLYLALGGNYARDSDPQRLLAEQTEALISVENTTWSSSRQQALDAGEAEKA
jgi:hypothetical protein